MYISEQKKQGKIEVSMIVTWLISLLLALSAAMKLDITKVKKPNMIKLSVIQQNQAGSFNLQMDKQDTVQFMQS